jgi:hypothetical protein
VLSIEPHDGAGGCWPSPRKDKLASAMMAVATEIVACTINAGRMFGRMCFTAMRTGGLATARGWRKPAPSAPRRRAVYEAQARLASLLLTPSRLCTNRSLPGSKPAGSERGYEGRS